MKVFLFKVFLMLSEEHYFNFQLSFTLNFSHDVSPPWNWRMNKFYMIRSHLFYSKKVVYKKESKELIKKIIEEPPQNQKLL